MLKVYTVLVRAITFGPPLWRQVAACCHRSYYPAFPVPAGGDILAVVVSAGGAPGLTDVRMVAGVGGCPEIFRAHTVMLQIHAQSRQLTQHLSAHAPVDPSTVLIMPWLTAYSALF